MTETTVIQTKNYLLRLQVIYGGDVSIEVFRGDNDGEVIYVGYLEDARRLFTECGEALKNYKK